MKPVAVMMPAAPVTRRASCAGCRRAMRLWALDWKRQSGGELKRICLKTAIHFRDDWFGWCGCALASDPAESGTAERKAA